MRKNSAILHRDPVEVPSLRQLPEGFRRQLLRRLALYPRASIHFVFSRFASLWDPVIGIIQPVVPLPADFKPARVDPRKPHPGLLQGATGGDVV